MIYSEDFVVLKFMYLKKNYTRHIYKYEQITY